MKRSVEEKTQPTLPGTDLETLPLFSGTPVRVSLPAPADRPANSQQMVFGGCPICRGTGQIFDGKRRLFCTCRAGEEARVKSRQTR